MRNVVHDRRQRAPLQVGLQSARSLMTHNCRIHREEEEEEERQLEPLSIFQPGERGLFPLHLTSCFPASAGMSELRPVTSLNLFSMRH